MVACPCALALAPPFSYNIVANFFASKGLFLRKPAVAGQLGQINQVVFDKTGTLTEADKTIAIIPTVYTAEQRELLFSIASQSRHPYSTAVCKALYGESLRRVTSFSEKQGKGVSGMVGNIEVLLGNLEHVSGKKTQAQSLEKVLWFRIGEVVLDPILLEDVYRNKLGDTLAALKQSGKRLFVASGDIKQEAEKLAQKYPNTFDGMEFQASPSTKAALISQLQQRGHVMMVGDGLNDAGALKTGDVGIVVAENSNNFTPEASAILLQSSFDKLPHFMRIARKANRIVKETFIVSLIYNAIALSLAMSGEMSPLIAAILMPASSVALMLYAWGRTKLSMKKEEGI
jgi:Cu+-exporting ATPase